MVTFMLCIHHCCQAETKEKSEVLQLQNNLIPKGADITRYRDYIKDLGKNERVEVIALPSSLVQRSVFQDALDLLVSLDALKAPSHHRGKCEPTLYGNLLGSLPLSLEASMLVIKFGQCGFLREGAIIGLLMDA